MYTHDLFYLQQEWEAWLVPIYKQIRTSKSQHNVQNINVNKTYIRIKSMLPWLKWYITITIQRSVKEARHIQRLSLKQSVQTFARGVILVAAALIVILSSLWIQLSSYSTQYLIS